MHSLIAYRDQWFGNIRSDRARRAAADRRGSPAAGSRHAVRIALRDDRLRQRTGDPHHYGATAGTDRRAVAETGHAAAAAAFTQGREGRNKELQNRALPRADG